MGDSLTCDVLPSTIVGVVSPQTPAVPYGNELIEDHRYTPEARCVRCGCQSSLKPTGDGTFECSGWALTDYRCCVAWPRKVSA